MNDFPQINLSDIDVDASIMLLEGSAGLFSLPGFADAAHNVAVYAAALEVEEEFPGLIRDEISVKGAHMCALAENALFHCDLEPNWDHPSLRDHRPR